MYSVQVKSPEGECVELLKSSDETYAKGAQAGINALLRFLEDDMDFEEGFVAEVVRTFQQSENDWSFGKERPV